MHKRRPFSVVLVLAAVLVALSTPTPKAQDAANGVFTIHLSHDVTPQDVLIWYATPVGLDVNLRLLQTRAGAYDYPLDLGPVEYLKVLTYAPGYRVVVRDFRGAGLSAATYSPPLVPMGTTKLTGRFVDAAGRPVTGAILNLAYEFNEPVSYFTASDGLTTMLWIDRVVTDNTGAFSFDVPAFSDDPFFQQYAVPTQKLFRIQDGDGPATGIDDTLALVTFGIEKSYAPITLTRRR